MKKTALPFFILILFTGFAEVVFGQQIVLEQSNPSGIYKKGEAIQVSASLNDLAADALSVVMLKNNEDTIFQEQITYSGKKIQLFDSAINEPTSLIFEVKVGETWASTGLVVDPENFKPGTKAPKDLAAYWKKEKKALRALPMDVKAEPVPDIEKGFVCSNMEISCTGPKPARGYFAKPEKAQAKSLPIVLYVHAAGVKGSWCLSQPENAMNYAKMGKGALAFDLNAHGMLNGQPQSYYDELEEGELKNYSRYKGEGKNDIYFKGMYLRLLRTLDFLTSQPEWDGKRIIVIGESQGGGQALAAAGLDHRVTAAVATVPAMCDWMGPLVGRKGGWPQPFDTSQFDESNMLEALPYFDNAYLLKNSKATLVTEIGFIDQTCPPASIYAAINQSKGEKIVFGVPYRGHHVDQKSFEETWEKTVYQPKMDFIENFLK